MGHDILKCGAIAGARIISLMPVREPHLGRVHLSGENREHAAWTLNSRALKAPPTKNKNDAAIPNYLLQGPCSWRNIGPAIHFTDSLHRYDFLRTFMLITQHSLITNQRSHNGLSRSLQCGDSLQ